MRAFFIAIGLVVTSAIANAGPIGVAAPPPLWLDATGHPTPAARQALALLASAADDGLQPADYHANVLGAGLAALEDGRPGGATTDAAAWDAALTRAVARYLHDLHLGRVDPHALGFRVRHPAEPTSIEDSVRAAVAQQQLPQLAQSLRPPFAEYALLRQALQRYRALAASAQQQGLRPPAFAGTVRPGQPCAQAPELARWLATSGDLDSAMAVSADRYDGVLVDALERFQARHGLQVDGVIGAATQRALRVPPAMRVAQLEWAMERLRWLAPLDGQRFIAINIPMFRLWAVDAARGAPLSMAVVVGKALDTRTPVLEGSISQVIFRPYWNVPRSILLKEVLPREQREPGYLASQDLEIVQGGGDDARPMAITAEHLTMLRDGRLRLRQRPGAKNALGRVKFVFPNEADVYLHDTPTQALFGRARRDFSHGCVRLEHPLELAQWVLADEPGWTREHIDAAAAGPAVSLRVALHHPVRVLLFYMTAMVMPDDGSVHFAEDVYGHDARLQRALAARSPR